MNNKKMIGVVLAFIIVAMWVFGPLLARLNSNNGIVILEGYPHAVGFCGQAGRIEESTAISHDGHIFSGKNYFLVINNGHQNDEQLQNLKALALVECN